MLLIIVKVITNRTALGIFKIIMQAKKLIICSKDDVC